MLGGEERRGRLPARTLGIVLTIALLTVGAPVAAGADELPAPVASSAADSPSPTAQPPSPGGAPPSDTPTATPSPSPSPSAIHPATAPTSTPTPTPTPAATPPAPLPLAITLPADPVLTLPNGDGFRDALTATVTSPIAATLTITAVRAGRTVTVAKSVSPTAVAGGWSARIRVPVGLLTAGSWTLHAAQATRTVAATRALRVGSGAARTLSVTPDRSAYFPRSPGAPSRIGVTVRAADETGATVPVAGTVKVTEGRAHRTATITRAAPGVGRVSVSGFPVGTGAVSVRVTGPAGPARTLTRSVRLQPTVIRRVTAGRSWPSVQPVVDDQLDTVTLSASATSSSGVVVPVHGDIRISRGGTVVRSWSLSSSAARRVVWDGRVGGRIVAGSYTVTVRERGPDGGTVTATTTVSVSTVHLPYRVRVVATLGGGNQQGLAIGRVGGATRVFAGVDVGGGNARIDEYDLTGKPIASSAPLPLGHAAEIAVGADGLLYVANGSATASTRIAVVDPVGWSVVRGIDAGTLGVNGMIAADPAGGFVVFANRPGEPSTVTPMAADGTLGASVQVPDPGGLPQGIEVVDHQWWIYTSLAGGGNRITKVDPATGEQPRNDRARDAGRGGGRGDRRRDRPPLRRLPRPEPLRRARAGGRPLGRPRPRDVAGHPAEDQARADEPDHAHDAGGRRDRGDGGDARHDERRRRVARVAGEAVGAEERRGVVPGREVGAEGHQDAAADAVRERRGTS